MQRLIERLRTGRMFSMTGAGLSAWAGYPVWSVLLHRLEQRVQEVRDGEVDVALIRRRWRQSPLEFAGRLGRELGDDFLRFLRAQFGVGGGTGLAHVLFQFASLPFHHHMTLNYDDSLERSHPNGLQSCASVTSADRGSFIEFLERCDDPTYGKKAVHCHGLHTDPLDGLILTEPGYAAFYQDRDLFKQIYWALLSTRSFLFAGFGFTDKDFLDALQAWKRDTRARENDLVHFAIYGLSAGEDDEAVRARLAGTYRIDSIFYEVLRRVIRKAVGGRRAVEDTSVSDLLRVADENLQKLREQFQQSIVRGIIQQSGGLLMIPPALQSDLAALREIAIKSVNSALKHLGLQPI